jgi:phospholipid/cholesterol/gamma-HCH transport system substrate-binding protein
MDDRVKQFRIGVMVLAALLIGGILVVMFGKLPTFGVGSYVINLRFSDAPGVSPNTPIRRSGILVGRVESVEFDEQRQVIVRVKLNDDFQIRRDEGVKIVTSLLGDAELQVIPLPQAPPNPTFYQPNETIQGQVANNPLNMLANLEGQVSTTVASLGRASDEIAKLANNVNTSLANNKDKFDSIVANTDQALVGINKAVNSLQGVLGDPSTTENFRKSLREIPELMATTKNAIEGLERAMVGIDRNVRNLEGITEPLGKRGPEIVANMDQSIARVNATLAEVERFSKQLNSNQGTVGQLLNNPELYQQLNEAASNINDVSQRLKPIVEDVRILTDRVSRNPGIVIRDAVKPGAGTKWSTPQRMPDGSVIIQERQTGGFFEHSPHFSQ